MMRSEDELRLAVRVAVDEIAGLEDEVTRCRERIAEQDLELNGLSSEVIRLRECRALIERVLVRDWFGITCLDGSRNLNLPEALLARARELVDGESP